MKAFVYCWTNKENGMKYIGSHIGTIDDGYTGSGKRFLNAIKKYGIELFERNILEFCNIENILEVEQKYLDRYNVAKSESFYNISPNAGGGDCGNGIQISKTKKSKKVPAWNKGISLDTETIKALSDTWEIEKDGIKFVIENMSKFCRENNLNASTMSAVARGNRSHHKGYKCKKILHKRNIPYEYKEWISKGHSSKANYGKNNGYSKRVCINNVWYDSMREASDNTGLSMYMIRKNGVFDVRKQ